MGRTPRDRHPGRVRGWATALLAGVAFGLLEGLAAGGPGVSAVPYRALVALVAWWALAGRLGALGSLRLLPAVVVLQDATARIARVEWIGDVPALLADAPDWYTLALLLTLALEAAAYGARRARRDHERARENAGAGERSAKSRAGG